MNLFLSRDQVRRVDELAISEYGIAGVVLMENAGRGAAEWIDRLYGPGGRAFIACGTGNNGGDGLVIARHLHNRGWTVRVVIVGDDSRLSSDAAANDRVVRAMKLERIAACDEEAARRAAATIRPNDVVIDALLGTGMVGPARGGVGAMIEAINAANKRAVVAVDIPSGLDCDTGEGNGPTVRANLTLTFVGLKKGFTADSARTFLGRCEVVDIGAPRELPARAVTEAKA